MAKNTSIFMGTFGFLWTLTAWSSTFDYADLTQIIRKNHVTTIDELLPLLPRDYRSNYTFVYDSLSAQKAKVSPSWPRTILYGSDARLLMAFTKDPQMEPRVDEPDTLEVIEYNDVTKAFVFRELTFVKGQDPLKIEPERNPARCLGCHGRDPRPNWESYNVWPGVFGSVSRVGCDTMQPGTAEMHHYQTFMAGNRKRERYRFLPTEIDDPKCPHNPSVELTSRNAVVNDANFQLTRAIAELNIQRINRLVKSSPLFEKYKYVWSAGFSCDLGTTDLESFFPEGFAKAHGYRPFTEVQNAYIDFSRLQFARRLLRFGRNNAGSHVDSQRQPVNFGDDQDPLGTLYHDYRTSALIQMVAERMHLDSNRWSTAFVDGELDFSPYARGLAETFMVDGSVPNETCEYLRDRSIAAFNSN